MGQPVLAWLVLLIIFIVVELATLGLATIWFAGGALIAALAAMLGAPVFVQIVLFVLVSCILLVFTRPIAVKYFNKDRIKTNAESLVGMQAIVISEIDNLQGTGRVTVNGIEWMGRSIDKSKTIAVGEVVIIRAIDGVKLIVEERKEG
ncbi:MAG: NfeD family protein [Lachnospiraceae bacterium]|nr:NfeD family protein [Lachnospiraceae bacterium]